MANKSSSKKTMDVSKPGESTPDTSARPVLVSNRPMVQDPTVKDEKAADAPAEPKTTTMAHSEKIIKPVSTESPTDAPEEPTDETSEKPENPPAEPEETEQEKSEEKPEEAKAAEEAAVVDAVVDQATADKKKLNKETDEDIARQAELQKLVNEKRYFVPIGQVSRRRNRRVVIAILVLLLLTVGAYLAVDAELIDAGVELPIDLIKV